MNDIEDLALARIKHIEACKDEILEAFIAKYGFEPERMVLIKFPPDRNECIVQRLNDEELRC